MAKKANSSEALEIYCNLDRLLEENNMTLKELSRTVGISVPNLSILKNNRAQAIRFSTLAAICTALDCEVGDLLKTPDLSLTSTDS